MRLHSGDDEWHAKMKREQEERDRIFNLPENVKARAFRKDLRRVFKKHGLSLAHQDMQGSLIITNQRMEQNLRYLDHASVDIRDNPKESDPGHDPNFNPDPAQLNHDHAFLYQEDEDESNAS
jgi:hypothetical protein